MRTIYQSLLVCCCSILYFSLVHAQIISQPDPTGLDIGHQQIQTLIITEDGTVPASFPYDFVHMTNTENLVMWLSAEPFLQGNGQEDPLSTGNTYDDYIWIPTGAISNGSLLVDNLAFDPDAIAGMLEGRGLDDGDYAEGFDDDGEVIVGSLHEYRSYTEDGTSAYRDPAAYQPGIYVGCPDGESCRGSDASLTVRDGAAKIVGNDYSSLTIYDESLFKLGDENNSTPQMTVTTDSLDISTVRNSNSSAPLAIGDVGDQLVVGNTTPDGDATLTVEGGVATHDSWMLHGEDGTNLAINPNTEGSVFESSSPIVIQKRKHTRVSMLDDLVDRSVSAAGFDGNSLRVILTPPQCRSCNAHLIVESDTPVVLMLNDETPGAAQKSFDRYVSRLDKIVLRAQDEDVAITFTNGLLASATDFVVTNAGEFILFDLFEKEDLHVAMGLNPSTSASSRLPDASLTVNGGMQIRSNNTAAGVTNLKISNFSPSNPVYKTLEEVNCKLLTIDDEGYLQLVEYLPERCEDSVLTYAWQCVESAAVCKDSQGNTVNDSFCDGQTEFQCDSAPEYQYEWICRESSSQGCIGIPTNNGSQIKIDILGNTFDWSDGKLYAISSDGSGLGNPVAICGGGVDLTVGSTLSQPVLGSFASSCIVKGSFNAAGGTYYEPSSSGNGKWNKYVFDINGIVRTVDTYGPLYEGSTNGGLTCGDMDQSTCSQTDGCMWKSTTTRSPACTVAGSNPLSIVNSHNCEGDGSDVCVTGNIGITREYTCQNNGNWSNAGPFCRNGMSLNTTYGHIPGDVVCITAKPANSLCNIPSRDPGRGTKEIGSPTRGF